MCKNNKKRKKATASQNQITEAYETLGSQMKIHPAIVES